MVSTTQHHGENSASIWRKFVRLIRSILALMQHPVLALLVGITLCCTAAGQTLTATSLGVSSGSILVGASETLTATVMSGGLAVTAGSVEFRDNLASPGGSVLGKTPLNGSGSGQLTLSSVGHGVHLGMGLHEISAIYTGSSGLAVSVSAYQAVTVSGTSQLPTATAISSTGVAGNYMLTGTVSALTSVLPTGIVSFLDASNGNAVLATQTLDPASKSFGFASFSTASALSGVTCVVVGDFNGDGHLDLAVANTYSGTVSILLGDGTGNFTLTATITVGYYPYSIAVGDFNGDGNLDLAVANYASGTVSILLGDGTGNFSAGATLTVGNSPYSIAAGDFNGDGNLDLAVANSADGTVSILLGDGTGNFTLAATVTVGNSPHSVVAGDFLGNGNLDLAVANSGDGTVSILKGDGTGNFSSFPNSPVTVGYTPTSVAVGDFNGDGILDLAVANECGNDPRCSSAGTVSILLSDGAGNFLPAVTSPVTVGVNPWSIAVGDFNNDGNLDLAVANFTNGTVSVLLGDGAGNFTSATALPVSVGVKPESVAVGDFNGDGNPDLAVANYTDGTVSVLHAVWAESASAPVIFSTPASHNVLASYPGDSMYAFSQSTSMPLLGLLNTGLVWTPVDTIIYGTTLSALLNATTTYGGAPAPSTCSYTATPSGGSASPVDSSTVLGVGPYTLGVSCTGLYPATTGTAALTVYATGYVLTTGANHPLEGTVTPATGNIYSPTTQVAITATANPGYSFAGWLANTDISNASSANTTVTMNAAETVTADFETVPSFAVNTNQDDSSTPAASNCPANPPGTGSGACTLRDALLAAAAAGGNISFDPTVFRAGNTAAANTITLGVDGTLMIPTNTILTGATSGSGATLTNLVTVNGASASTVFTLIGGTVAILNNLTIENGLSGGNGGGISNSGKLTVNECTFAGNSASNGGGIDSSGTLMVSGNTFVGNSASNGGGIRVETGGAVTVSGSTFYNNSGTNGGGAIDSILGASLAVTGSTFYGNSSTNSTGGIAVSHSSFSMSNTITTGNGNGDCTVYRSACPANGTGGNVVGVPANLAAPGNYGGPTETMIPLPGSVAICAIVPTGTGTDQRGVTWPVSYSGTSCQDAGAVQTDYSLSFFQQPSTTLSLTPISPAPTVELQESGIPFASSVTIPLTLKDSSGDDISSLDLSGGSAATSGGVATYSPLGVAAAGTGDTLTANLMLNSASTPATAISSTSNPFNVILKPTTTVSSDALATYSASVQSIPLSATVTSSMGTVNAGTVTFTVMQGSTTIGTPVTSGTVSSGAASVNYSLPGGTTAGMYTVQAMYNSSGGGFAISSDGSHTLTVGMTTATVTLGSLSQIYTGSPLAATATTTPSGLTVNLTYNGSSTAPTAVGSYAVVGTINDTNHQGSSSNTLVISKATPAISWAAPAAIAYGTALSAAQLDASSVVGGTFVYTPTAGVVPTAGPQTLSVTFTPTDSSDYSTAMATVQLTVNKATATVTLGNLSQIYTGSPLAATATTTPSGLTVTFTYNGSSTVPTAAGSYTVVGTISDSNYQGSSSNTLVIGKATPAISWATPAAIAYGTALSAAQLDASSTVAGTFVYSPPAGTALTVGSQTLSVTFTPTDSTDYNTATSTVQLTVNKATPAIPWAAPAAITYGTALSAAQLNASSTVAGTFVYTPAVGAVLSVGTQTLSVTFTPTDSSDYTTATGTVQLTVNKATPAIPWTAPAAIAYGTALSAAQLDASSTVAGTFVYTPAAGVVPTAGSQTLSVTFTPTDSSDYTTATSTVQLTVNKATPAISWATPAAIAYGTALSAAQLDASSTVAGTFVYTPAAGVVPTAGPQTLSVTFTPTDSSDYSTATATVQLTVNKAAPAIPWAAPAAIAYGTALSAAQLDASSTVAGTFVYTPTAGVVLGVGTQNLSVTFTPTDSSDYTTATSTVQLTVNKATPAIPWTAPAAIAYGTALSAAQLDASSTVAGTFVYTPAAGVVLTAGSQTLSVTFTPTDSSDYTTATSTVQLTVNKATPVVTWAAPAAIAYGTALSAAQLDASSVVGGTFVYTPAAGVVPTAGPQTLSVTFTPTDSSDYSTAMATVQLTVNKATATVTLGSLSQIYTGSPLAATATTTPSGLTVTFTYNGSSTVPTAAGSYTVVGTISDSNYQGSSNNTLVIGKATPAISWAAPAAIAYGTALSAAQLDASSTVAGTFVYSPPAGTALTVGSQTLSVTFTPTDSTDYNTATSTVQLTVNKATPAIPWAAPAAITYGTALSAAQLNASSTVAGTFVYTPAVGAVLSVGTQTLSVTFTPTDSSDYTTATGTVQLTVNKATPAIPWTAPAAIAYGTALSAAQLDASSTVAGTFVYTPAAGVVPTAGSQTLSVTFTPTDSSDYTTATSTVQLTVNKATPAISWATPAAIAYGTALSAAQLDASSTVAGTFVYTPAAGVVPTAGPQTLSVTFTPTDSSDYSTATATVQLTVNKAAPAIPWAAPAAIAYGTALSAAQLDASSTVAGTFVYTPTAGVVLGVGTQNLSVTFTPTDSSDYTTATGTVQLTVNKATPAIPWTAPAAIAYGTALSAAQLDASSTVAGTFVYTPAAGVVLTAGSQTLSVTFTPTDSSDYTTATSTVQLTVNKATPVVTWAAPAAIAYGTALSAAQLDASSVVGGTFVYTPTAGVVPTAGPQTLSVTFTPTDSSDYSTAMATVQLTVNKATATVTLGSLSQIYTGSPLAATATTTPSGLTVTFTYNGSSTVPTAAGSYTVVGTISDSNYQGSSNNTLVIGKATPAISWAAPAAIAYGTALSAAQLDASSTVAGTFVYSPPAGTALTVGSQTLSVTFTPTDSTDYNTATSTVQLTVNKATPAIPWAAPAAITYGTALSAAQLNASSTVAGTFVYTPAVGAVLSVGTQTLSVTFTPTDSSDYTTATGTVQLTVNTIPQTISFTSPSPLTYGSAPITLTATGGASGNPIIFSIISGSGSITGSTLTINGAGSVVVAANQAGNASYAAATQVTQIIVVNPALTAIAVASSASTVLTQNAVTLTATVSSPAGIPTGTVSFLDGTTPIGPGTLSGGVATLTTTSLAVGTHSISGVYSGGTNFVAATSAALTQCVMDFSLSVSGLSAGGTSQTVTPGGSAVYSLAIAPSSGTSFPVAVTLTVSGLPTTTTASVIPSTWALSSSNPWTWTMPANTPLTNNSQLTIQLPQSLALVQPKGAAGDNLASRLTPFTLALLILPFAGRMRRTGKRLGRAAFMLLLLVAGIAAMAGLSGCGSPSIFFTQQLETYSVTVTVSAGTLSHSMPVTLVVE